MVPPQQECEPAFPGRKASVDSVIGCGKNIGAVKKMTFSVEEMEMGKW
jgi:hypothetical protein